MATPQRSDHAPGSTSSLRAANTQRVLDVESEFSGQVLFRVDKGGQAFLVRDTYRYRGVLTNRETGEWFVIRGRAVFHEIKATQVGGKIYESRRSSQASRSSSKTRTATSSSAIAA